MNKKTWDLYAPIYKRAMKADQKIYDFMYERIPEMVKDVSGVQKNCRMIQKGPETNEVRNYGNAFFKDV